MVRVPFRARARTVDHLGREQIADLPTAVSELWKNAYDAYARAVGLHVFDGNIPVAAVVDDGHGMSRDEFVERWLMLGTEAKVGGDDVPEEDRDGFSIRPRQGQKGIGRLSVAYLGPTALVLSKRAGHRFVASLLDWRLFQNPYLALDDIRVPVEEFDGPEDFPQILPQLFDGLVENIWGSAEDAVRRDRLADAWHRFSHDEKFRGEEVSADAIAGLALDATLEERHLAAWPTWTGERDRGTALFVFDVGRELRVWVDQDVISDDPEVKETREKLQFTLTGFTDPYSGEDSKFSYEAVAHRSSVRVQIVSSDEVFDIYELRNLEHVVEGQFDELGVFTGHVRAWGRDLGEVTLPPARPLPQRGRAYVGPFEICFGTFEQETKNSTHTADVVGRLKEQADRFSGLAVYRDGLRVQPYGRPEADFFGMEERRQKNLGREFWAHRRTFGRVAITKAENSHLRDKAGREGLIDNQAAREFRYLVIELLRTLARRYFGTDSGIRKSEVAETQARFERARQAEENARKRRVSYLRNALRENADVLQQRLTKAKAILDELEHPSGTASLDQLAQELDDLHEARAILALPPRPRRLPDSLEERYRSYRDTYAELTATLERASTYWSELAAANQKEEPTEVLRRVLSRHQKFLTDSTGKWKRTIRELLSAEQERWTRKADEDNTRYYRLSAPLLDGADSERIPLVTAISELENIRERIFVELARDYEGYIRALRALHENIDLEAASAWATDERTALLEKVDQWQGLAQIGITVEIIGHELNDTAAQVSRNLARLPTSIRESEAYKLVLSGFRALVHRLEFLAPLRLSGPRMREPITGAVIEQYLREFFERQISDRRVELVATPAFQTTTVEDYPYRIIPAFVNLINNALYWVTFGTVRRIVLDRRGTKVYVADSGPGVDEDDVPELFSMFFTRRVGGHGVGLYLSRLNLEQGGHRLRYADPDERILPGANFVIEFRDLADE